jgi:hypothetical protein
LAIKNFVEKINNSKIVRVVLPLIVLLEIGRTFYQTNTLYILSRVLLFYFFILAYNEAKKNKQLKIYIILVLLFALWALVTTIWSYEPMVTFPRAFYFAYVSIAAAVAGYLWYTHFPKSFLSFLLPANIIIVLISLFSLVANLPADAWTGGCGIGFMGFAPHQNTLGMMILLTIPSVLFPVFSFLRIKPPRNEPPDFFPAHVSRLTFHSLLLILNLYLLLLTHSRASIVSVLLIVITFFLFSFNWKYVIATGLTLVMFIAALFFASPQIKTSVTDFIFKTENTIGDRRSTQLEATFSAAQHGGIIGLGYGISDPKNIIEKDKFVGQRYYREKMISGLALVEEVGVVGLTLFLAIIGYVFWLLLRTFKIQHSTFDILRKESFGQYSTGKLQAVFMIAVLAALSFDAQIEAWWLGAGSWQFVLFFIFLGTALRTARFLPQSKD